MSNTEIDYADTDYQKTNYEGSNEESQWQDEDDEVAVDQEGELPEMVDGMDNKVPEMAEIQAGPAISLDATEETHNGSSLPRAVLEILQARWPAWKAADKDQRKIYWKGIVAELRALEMHQTMDKVEWKHRLKVSKLILFAAQGAKNSRPTLPGCILKEESEGIGRHFNSVRDGQPDRSFGRCIRSS
jgi:hypothetical protein